ncbi:MAG: L-threonine 3-dehydrogenase, partial [Elusimicrobia bacterium]|nr:L-threonine 3-dehydrogenase [Elusimicrobiota bacterium]
APGADYIEMKEPKIKSDELLIKVHRASICGSDMPIYNYTGWAPDRIKLPFVFGHELCGEVVGIGSKTRGFNKGDFVSMESHIFCGHCYQCKNDQRHVCANMKGLGFDCAGGFSEYAAVPARCAWKHSDNSLRDIGSLLEPFGNAVYAVLVEDIVSRSILVTGCGAQGLFAIAIAKACGASTVIAVEGSPFRKKLAKKMGADAVIDPSETNILSKIKHAAKSPEGVDVVLEMSGNPAAIDMGLKAVKNAGRYTAFGLAGKKIELDYSNSIVFKGIKIYAIYGREIFRTWYRAESLLKSKAVDIRPVITHTFPLKDYKKAFEVMGDKEKKCGKVLLVP